VLNPLHAGRGAVRIPHHDDVESHRQPREVCTLLQELLGGAGDALLFAPVDARRRAAIGGRARVRTSAITSRSARRATRSSSPSRRR
jgi:hypothetical protein